MGDARRVFATLVRLRGDFDLAEEALHDAFRAALEQWPQHGTPSHPTAWLVSTGRFKTIDSIRRQARFTSIEDIAEQVAAIVDEAEPDELPMRMASVLRVLYLVFNEGYSPSSGAVVTRADLSREAIRLTRLIVNLMTTTHTMAEVYGLLALMLLNESRRAARTDGAGELVPLEAQDRARGIALVDDLLQLPAMQEYHLAHAARADMCRRLHRFDEARVSYRAATFSTRSLIGAKNFLQGCRIGFFLID